MNLKKVLSKPPFMYVWGLSGRARIAHTNNGVANHAFALLVDGGAFLHPTVCFSFRCLRGDA